MKKLVWLDVVELVLNVSNNEVCRPSRVRRYDVTSCEGALRLRFY